MCTVRTTKRKEKIKSGFKRWLPLEQLFLALMIIAFIAQFCIVLPRNDSHTHTSTLRGSFKVLQPYTNQTTPKIANIRPEMNPPATIEIRGALHDVKNPSPRLMSGNQTVSQTRVPIQLRDSNQTKLFQTTNATNYARRKHLRNQCDILSKTRTRPRIPYMRKDIVRIITSPSLSLVYCRVNKAASWYTIRVLEKVLNCNDECLQRYSQRIRSLSYSRKKAQIRNSFKFMFVREPYGRLFSTYCNKYYLPKGIWDPIGIDIIRRYRKIPSAESLKYGYDVTFAELVRYTVDEFEAGNKMDAHVRPMYYNCKPCDYEYDFIGKIETFESDMNYLAHEWKMRNISTSIPEKIGEKSISFDEMLFVQEFLEKVKNSRVDAYNLYKRSWRYYQITSVISKHIDMPFARTDNIKFNTFLVKLKDASEMSRARFPDLKDQKHEALLQAYNSVPLKDLERLKNVVKEDCLLFGYEETPSWVFNRNSISKMSNSFNYFIGFH